MQKHVVTIYADDEHQEIIAKTIESMVQKMKDLKAKGQLKNTWYNIHSSSEDEWKRETMRQAHNIAKMQILGDKRGQMKHENLSEDTKTRIEQARQRIFRAMIP